MFTNLALSSKRGGSKQGFITSLIKKALFNIDDDCTDEFYNIVTKARQDMYDAENFFDNVTEPELVDHAIYKIEAAKTKYIYLIKQAKEKGIRIDYQI